MDGAGYSRGLPRGRLECCGETDLKPWDGQLCQWIMAQGMLLTLNRNVPQRGPAGSLLRLAAGGDDALEVYIFGRPVQPTSLSSSQTQGFFIVFI